MEEAEKPATGEFITISDRIYSILPDPATIYYLYNSVRLFYENGGGDAYIVSVGTYGPPSGEPLASPVDQVVNPNVVLADLQAGLELLKSKILKDEALNSGSKKQVAEPTMYICPEATLLSKEENGTLMQTMLQQAESERTAICLFDVIGGRNPDPLTYANDIDTFRDNTGSNGLKFGVAYYPFIATTIMETQDIDFSNLFGGDIKQLESFINPPDEPNLAVATILGEIEKPPANPSTVSQYNSALLIASSTYALLIKHVLKETNLLPPSGGMAGVYTNNDNTLGVWNLPANVSIVGAADLPIRLTDTEQKGLNFDPVSGKSINAIRYFSGSGILVWGARTLDGNSQDWRYVSVRRTLTMLEQSCKFAARSFVFEPNNANTWSAVKSMISNFLTNIWKQGGLQGASALDAFQVEVGLGSTMTAEDLLNGIMRIVVKVAVAHPAEFIVISIQQEMAKQSGE